jgi:ATP-dependent DNA helicase RecQ
LPEAQALPALAEQNFDRLCSDLMDRHQSGQRNSISAESLTRFLCGVTEPLLTQIKARSLSGFAALEQYPYAEVRQWVRLNSAV